MRKAARAIVIRNSQLLVMYRNKFGTQYVTLPGGNVEMGETPEQAAARETTEESTVTVTNPRLVFIDHAGDPYGDQYVYLFDYVSGEPILNPDSTEARIHAMGKNLYEPKWLPLDDLPAANFLSPELKAAILEAVKGEWPQQPKEFTSNRTI